MAAYIPLPDTDNLVVYAFREPDPGTTGWSSTILFCVAAGVLAFYLNKRRKSRQSAGEPSFTRLDKV